MALQVTKTNGFEIFTTGVNVNSAYIRIETKNDIFGKEKATVRAFASKEHYTNTKSQKLSQFTNVVIAVSGFKLENIETSNLQTAHENLKAQFEANGYDVQIVDL